MNTLLWILVGVLAYSAVAVALQTRGYLPRSVRLQGPLTTVHTKRGRAFLNWLAKPKRSSGGKAAVKPYTSFASRIASCHTARSR